MKTKIFWVLQLWIGFITIILGGLLIDEPDVKIWAYISICGGMFYAMVASMVLIFENDLR